MKKLLIVVDYQKDFVDGSLGFKEAQDLDDYLASLIDQYHQNKDDVIFTYDTHQTNYLESQEGKKLPSIISVISSSSFSASLRMLSECSLKFLILANDCSAFIFAVFCTTYAF